MSGKSLTPWEKVGDPTTLAGKFGKKLVTQDFRNPYTNEIEDYVLFGQKDWSVVMAVTEDGMVITNWEYKQGCDQVLHELSSGTADFKGEAPEDVMRRELLQETGYEPGEVISLGPPLFIAARSSWTRFHPFLAKDCRKIAEQELDDSEHIETELVPLYEWVKFCLEELIEPSAVVATFRALPYLGYEL